jgi:beta-lactamase regulating signal transducer with metallopeptidase domain
MKMSLIVFGALALSLALRRRSAALRHWVLAAGLACAATVPILTSIVPAWSLPFAASTAFSRYEDPFTEVSGSAPARTRGTAAAAPAGRAPVAASPSGVFDLPSAARTMWMTGAIAGLSILMIGLLRLAWLAVHAHRITSGRWYDLAQRIAKTYGLRRPVTLLQSAHPSLLVTWGLARPKVILPSAADTWTDERARVVLSHELAHIRRGDWIVQLSAELLRAVYWFNPLLWLACRRLRLESEHACDDEVMNRGVTGTEYATHLIDLARTLNQRRQVLLPAPAMARPSSLERRVRAMLNVHGNRRPLTSATRAAIFVLLFAATALVAAAQSSFVSFSGTISDESARGIPGTTVALTNETRQAKYEVKTNGVGRFEFVGLPPGDYGVEATGMGFQPLKDVISVSGQNVQRNYTLRLGTLQETIMVKDDVRDHGREPRPSTFKERPAPKRAECVPSGAGGQIVPPKKLRDFAPIYPVNLRSTGTSGTVVLHGRIALDGFITDIGVVGDAHPDFANAAIVAVREWHYTETLLNCAPVEVGMTISVTFSGLPPVPPPAPPKPWG